jgi:adenylate cyclase
MGIEIERKFLIKGYSVSEAVSVEQITQGYLFAGKRELRLRRQGGLYIMTYKSSGNLRRREIEVSIPGIAFDILWTFVGRKEISKIRSVFRLDGHVLEVDQYFGSLTGLTVLEVEFFTEQEAEAFTVPAMFRASVEVTSDARFKNKNLVKLSRGQLFRVMEEFKGVLGKNPIY